MDANDAATFGTTLDVTGATTLSSTLDVTGAATFTVQSVHSAGINTNVVQGADGSLVLNADAGDNIEIQVDGVKKAEITAEGDVIASRHARANSVPCFTMQWSGTGVANQDISDDASDFAISATDVDDPEGVFNRASGEFTAPVDGIYLVSIAFHATATRLVRFFVDSGSGYAIERKIKAGGFSGSTAPGASFFYRFSAGDTAKLQVNQPITNDLDATMFSIGLIA